MRNSLREYCPGALATFEDLGSADALAVLTRAPDPARGVRLTLRVRG